MAGSYQFARHNTLMNMIYDQPDGRFVRRLGKPHSVSDAGSVVAHVQEAVFPKVGQYMQEEMWSLLLNCREQITHDVLVSRGTLDSSLASPSIIFRDAIRLGASRVIIVHNHPSGCPDPSQADVLITKRLRLAGELLDIVLLDHIILTQDGWYSFAQHEWGE
jgi:DNA repair protein RadC